MTLAETQALLHEVLTTPGSVEPGRIEACFAGTPEFPAVDRVAVYADMYLFRLVDALRETFPNVFRYLGDEQFAALAEDYVRLNPSRHHDVGQVGRHLTAFLRTYPDPERPDLADLAELEWARHQVFFAQTAEPVGVEALSAVAPDDFARASLLLSPALRVLVLDHDAASLWRRLENGERPVPASTGAFAVAVWRRGFDVFHAPVSLDEAVAIEGAMAGHSLASICASFGDQEDPVAAAHAALGSWLQEGWIVALVGPNPGTRGEPGRVDV
jgi:hypothetical protein